MLELTQKCWVNFNIDSADYGRVRLAETQSASFAHIPGFQPRSEADAALKSDMLLGLCWGGESEVPDIMLSLSPVVCLVTLFGC